jgi:hypothetical protein
MEKRIKCFISENFVTFQDCINDFLESVDGKLHDIKFSYKEFDRYETFCALIIYTPEDK